MRPPSPPRGPPKYSATRAEITASEEAMRRSEEASYWFRAFSAEVAGGEVTSVERYEVVFSERRAQH